MQRPALALTTLLATAMPAVSALAQTTTTTGSVGCATLAQAAANGMTARMAADGQTISQPTSVTQLSCLNNFFSGIGLNLVTNLLNPGTLLQSVEGELCNAVTSTWNSWLGHVQCGLTITGFNFGFGGLGGGLSCPSLSFGGGGPPVANIGLGAGTAGSGSGLYINGNGLAPPGYALPQTPTGSY
jgi:hypothetical protein